MMLKNETKKANCSSFTPDRSGILCFLFSKNKDIADSGIAVS
jgi:hypothetical protein